MSEAVNLFKPFKFGWFKRVKSKRQGKKNLKAKTKAKF